MDDQNRLEREAQEYLQKMHDAETSRAGLAWADLSEISNHGPYHLARLNVIRAVEQLLAVADREKRHGVWAMKQFRSYKRALARRTAAHIADARCWAASSPLAGEAERLLPRVLSRVPPGLDAKMARIAGDWNAAKMSADPRGEEQAK